MVSSNSSSIVSAIDFNANRESHAMPLWNSTRAKPAARGSGDCILRGRWDCATEPEVVQPNRDCGRDHEALQANS